MSLNPNRNPNRRSDRISGRDPGRQCTRLFQRGTRSEQGFTLVELMMVIAVLGIMAGVGGYGLLKGMPDRRLAGTTRDLYAWINEARSLAVQSGSRVSIDFDGDRRQVVTSDAGGQVLRLRILPEYISLDKVTGGSSFVFNSRGMKIGTMSGAVYVSYEGRESHRRRVRVTSVGSIAIQYPDGAGDKWQ